MKKIIIYKLIPMESFFNSTDEDKILTTNSTWNYPTFNKENVQRYDSVSVTITTSYPIDSGIYLRWSTDGTIWILGETYSTDSTHLNAVNNLYERTIVRDHRAKFFHIYVENTNGSDNTVCVQTIYKYNQQEIDIGATFNNGRMLVDTSLNDIGNIVDTSYKNTDIGAMALAVRSDVLDAIVTDTGDYTPLQVNASGALYVTGTQYEEDTEHLSGATGTMSLAVRSDILDAIVTDTGDYTPLQVDASGALYVTGTQYEEDTEHLPGATGTMSLAIRTDVLDATPAVNGAYRPLQVDACGSLYVTSSLPIGAATSIKQDIGNADLATLAATVSAGAVAITSAIPLEVKSIVAVGEWLSSAPLAAATYSTELNVSAYKSVRLIGKWATEITQMQIFGSQTTEGTYYSLGAENVLLGQTVTISGTTEYHTSAVIENTPPFLKLYNSEVSSVTLEVDYCAYAN